MGDSGTQSPEADNNLCLSLWWPCGGPSTTGGSGSLWPQLCQVLDGNGACDQARVLLQLHVGKDSTLSLHALHSCVIYVLSSLSVAISFK